MNCKQCGKYMNPVDAALSPDHGVCGACCKANATQAYFANQEPDKPPRTEEPSLEQLLLWDHEGGCESTDGCWIEPDGYCEHGNPSWLLVLGMI